MNREHRINELVTRQIYYGSSLVVKLKKINGEFWYTVYAWLNHSKEDTKFIVLMNKYENQDPEDLFKLALQELQVKKIKLGVVLT